MASRKTSPPARKISRKPAAPAGAVSPRIARRERRRERSRDEIVDAARRVLLRSGVAATTLEAVAKEVGVTKAALYYYYPSKDALLFDVVFGVLEAHARAVHEGVGRSENGGEALGAIVRETVEHFSSRLDDFRISFLLGQVSPGAASVGADQLARIRPLNELALAGAAKMLKEDSSRTRGRLPVEPRILAFLAYLSAIGLLTMKGMVESVGDPLLYSDEQLIDAFSQVFRAATAP